MRYRSFSQSGDVASAVSLVLPDVSMRESDRIKLVQAALEAGINTFEIQSSNPEVALALQKSLGEVERRQVNIGLRVTWSPKPSGAGTDGSATIANLISTTVERTGLQWLDMVILDAPDSEPPPYEAIAAIQNQRALGRVRRLGVGGEGDVANQHIRSGVFDILAMSFNVHSGWPERNRIKEAAAREMTVIACDRYPSRQSADLTVALARAGGVLGRLLAGQPADDPLMGPGYAFLNETPGWNAEQVCLAYALTEPAISTVQIDPLDIAGLKALAEVPELELPNGLAAQIEMARFSGLQRPAPVDKRRRRA